MNKDWLGGRNGVESEESTQIRVNRIATCEYHIIQLRTQYSIGCSKQDPYSLSFMEHNHRIRVDLRDTQVILEQLMVDAVIRVFAEIRFAFPHSFIVAIISRKSSPKSKPSVRSSPPSLSSSAHPADRHDVSRCLHASSRPSLGLRAGIRGLQSGFRLAERQFGGAGADGGRLHVRSR